MSMCRVISCVVGRGCLLWPVHSLGKTLLAFALFHCALQVQTCVLFQVSLDLLLLHSSPLWWKVHLCVCVCVCVLVLENLVCLHRTLQVQLLSIGWGIGLNYCDAEWFALETNRDHSVIFGIASKYCILDSFVDQDGYFICSKGFLPTLVDIMVTCNKFTYSSPL